MGYEKLYLKMCKTSGHKRFIPTQAILGSADKKVAELAKLVVRAEAQLTVIEDVLSDNNIVRAKIAQVIDHSLLYDLSQTVFLLPKEYKS